MLDDAAMSTPRSPFLATALERGFVHQCTDCERSTSASRAGRVIAYVGYRLHRGQSACRQPGVDHAAAPVSEMRAQADRADGRRHDADRRPLGQGRGAPAARRRRNRPQHGGHSHGLRQVPEFRRRARATPSWSTMPIGSTSSRYIPLLRDIGRHFSVNRMLTQDSVRLRLERDQPLSFLEFNYLILQAYDFLELARRFGCDLQIGGSDQWGNIVAGVELAPAGGGPRTVRPDDAADHDRLRRQDGQDRAGRGLAQCRAAVALRILAVLAQHRGRRCRPLSAPLHRTADLAEIERLEARRRSTRQRRSWRPRRPRSATAGKPPRRRPRRRAPSSRAAAAAANCRRPRCRATHSTRGMPAFELFSLTGLAASNGEARRLIRGGGARINDRVVDNETKPVSVADLDEKGVLKLSAGRKRHALVRPV